MKKRKNLINFLVILFAILLISFNAIFIGNKLFFSKIVPSLEIATFSPEGIGIIGLLIISQNLEIFIHSPQNITYFFTISDWLDSNLTLDLNVSSNTESMDKWWYTLEDVRHGVIVNNSVYFTPNTTINAVRWNNKLTVYANDTFGRFANTSVEFFISVPNTAPILEPIPDEMLACEGQQFSQQVNATDIDEDDLDFGIVPSGPFFIEFEPFGRRYNLTVVYNNIFSGFLQKNHAGTHQETVSVIDNNGGSDSKQTNITVIEINNNPAMENLTIFTVWTQGDNSTFYKEVQINDIESGLQSSGNFNFNLTFLNGVKFFDINKSSVMNFTGNTSLIGVYNISLCVTDQALANIHPNISLCNNDGLNNTVCDTFQVVVTNQNRQPRILSYYPANLTFNVQGTDGLYFNISKHDPDGGIPPGYWYVNGVLRELDEFSNSDNFTFSFGCGVSGLHFVKAEITDGELNDSVQWNITVNEVECPLPSAGGGGGGGGGGGCSEKWGCYDWQICKNAVFGLSQGELTGEDYRKVKEKCAEKNWNDEICGFQMRECVDVNSCDRILNRPIIFQECFYTENPTCDDGIKNCHTNGCELLVDCGGPCGACPTCSDGTQNQGEEEIDCGGPCPRQCPAESPLRKNWWWLLILLILLVTLIITIRRYYMLRKEEREREEKEKTLKRSSIMPGVGK
ncbi:hypothetical protein HYV50_00705 [Candidatus Pacearchaeota archaeon]|nr:hypothetical protein [Candidatus Pacearchaeota archaeon]